jgi:hypothetical protein
LIRCALIIEGNRATVAPARDLQHESWVGGSVNFRCHRRNQGEKENPMKTKIFAVAATLLLSVVATSVCYAQQTALAVNIPFAFQAGNRTLPAGEYRVESVLLGAGQWQRLRQVDGDAVMIMWTISVETQNGNPNPKLVFNHYGQTYFLSQIWTGEPQGHQLFKSDREKEMALGERETEIALLLHPTSVTP